MSAKNYSTLFFYKGTPFPQVASDRNAGEVSMKKAGEMIVLGLKHVVSLEQQKKDYKEQLDMMEERLSVNEINDESVVNRAMLSLGLESRDIFYSAWVLNICALLKMNVIKNDENNGVLNCLLKERRIPSWNCD